MYDSITRGVLLAPGMVGELPVTRVPPVTLIDPDVVGAGGGAVTGKLVVP